MPEIEIKILEIDGKKLRRMLHVHGAKLKYSGTMVAHFFRGANGKKIRLRNLGSHVTLTAKERVNDDTMLHNHEHEVEVSSFETTAAILEMAGLRKYGDSIKTRESYTLDDITYDFDTYPGIPEYLEIEAQSHEKVRE